MEITYIGHSCFKIKGKNLTIVIDPYDPAKTGYKLPKLSADVVLITHHHGDHDYLEGVSDYKLVIDTPGEYEISGTFINGIQTNHDQSDGSERGKNTIYQIDIDGFSLLHLGDLGHGLAKETLEKIGDIHVLMVPVGGTYTINSGLAAEVISSIEPAIIIPMHYQTEDLKGLSQQLDPLKVFLEEMGEENVKSDDRLKLDSSTSIPEESEVLVLNPQH